jgi:hypothetical protein
MYNYLPEVMSQSLISPTHNPTIHFKILNTLFSVHKPHIMPSKPKTSRRQHFKELIAVILKLYALGYLFLKIHDKTEVLKSIITRII